jgi:flagellar hook-basal body complex protein FliE
MNPIASAVGAASAPVIPPLAPAALPATEVAGSAPSQGFGETLTGLLQTVAAKQAAADQLTQHVLLGNGGQLHQSVIAMQEAGVAFSLMVQVRNKLVDSYQELMRMQA